MKGAFKRYPNSITPQKIMTIDALSKELLNMCHEMSEEGIVPDFAFVGVDVFDFVAAGLSISNTKLVNISTPLGLIRVIPTENNYIIISKTHIFHTAEDWSQTHCDLTPVDAVKHIWGKEQHWMNLDGHKLTVRSSMNSDLSVFKRLDTNEWQLSSTSELKDWGFYPHGPFPF